MCVSFSPRKVRRNRRTVDTPPTAKTLSAWHERRAISERCARTAGMHTHRARTRRDVRQKARRLPMRRVVMRRGTSLEYEDAQVRICRSKTACDDATSSATYRASSPSEEVRARGEEDSAPPAIMISYSLLISVGVDIVCYLLCWRKTVWLRRVAGPSSAP